MYQLFAHKLWLMRKSDEAELIFTYIIARLLFWENTEYHYRDPEITMNVSCMKGLWNSQYEKCWCDITLYPVKTEKSWSGVSRNTHTLTHAVKDTSGV